MLTTWHLYPHELAITSPTSGGRSVGIVRLRPQTMEFSLVLYLYELHSNITLLDQGYAIGLLLKYCVPHLPGFDPSSNIL
jgi:hypothetical protein